MVFDDSKVSCQNPTRIKSWVLCFVLCRFNQVVVFNALNLGVGLPLSLSFPLTLLLRNTLNNLFQH